MVKKDIIIFGKPGSGKGTLSKDVINGDTAVVHLSTGDVFRQHMKNNTALGIEIKDVMDSGELVNDELTIAIAEDFIIANKHKFIIFDGFPRNENQLIWLINWYLEEERPFPYFVGLDISDDICIERLSSRSISQGRPEDADVKIIKNRLNIYENETGVVKDLILDYIDIDDVHILNAGADSKAVYREFMYAINPDR